MVFSDWWCPIENASGNPVAKTMPGGPPGTHPSILIRSIGVLYMDYS